MHPQTAGKNWLLDELVYDDGNSGIAVALFTRTEGELALGFRWISDGKSTKIEGKDWPTPYFGKDSEWVLLPHAFAVPIAKVLIEKYVAGNPKINESGFRKMIDKLKNEEELLGGITY